VLDPRRLASAIVLAALCLGALRAAWQRFRTPDPTPGSASLRLLASRFRCGDVLMLGGLALAEVQYLLRQLETNADCLSLETFPGDTQGHPGWVDLPRHTQDPGALVLEAEQTAQRLSRLGRTVWLFVDDGFYPELTTPIKAALDRALGPPRTYELAGSWFDRVYEYYTERQGRGAGAGVGRRATGQEGASQDSVRNRQRILKRI
jgi:hypothetical protein